MFLNPFGFYNSTIRIIKIIKPKFSPSKKLRFWHFQQIPNERQEKQKYANYEALFFARMPVQTSV